MINKDHAGDAPVMASSVSRGSRLRAHELSLWNGRTMMYRWKSWCPVRVTVRRVGATRDPDHRWTCWTPAKQL